MARRMVLTGPNGFQNFIDSRAAAVSQPLSTELTDILAALPTAAQADVAALTSTTIAAAVPSVAPAGGTGAAEGAYDTAVNRDAMIATVNGLVALVNELKTDYEALRVDASATRTTLNGLLAKLRTAGIVTP